MNQNSNELHVIFGTGPVGAAVMRALQRRGKRIRMISRGGAPSLATGPVQGVEFARADAYDASSAQVAVAGATHVYQCAQPEYHEWEAKFPPLQASILNAAAAVDAKLILMENLYMYGDVQGAPIVETMPYRPQTHKGKVRAQLAEAWQAAHAQGKVRAVSGRASDFYGPAYLIMGNQIFYPAIEGKRASAIGSLDQPHTFSYTEDVGEALAILGEHDSALGQAWHIPSPRPITQRELLTMVFEAAGQTPKLGAVSPLMMRLAGMFVPGAREMVEMMYEFTGPFTLDSRKFTAAFGMKATPYRDSVGQTVEWFRAHPKSAAQGRAA
ncbi:MAG: NAD-dependent epimerase/dehydratase family protein [Anaerolineae bacterium]|nr:NAD-dependent epimerase/dehydratase family protein [Anaerolineae bacterium]